MKPSISSPRSVTAQSAASQVDRSAATDDALYLQALEEYAALCRAGEKPNRAEFLARYADVAASIEDCLDGIEFVEQIAPQLRDASADAAQDQSSSNSAFRIPHSALETLGDFRILRELGRGGMGVVYEAEQLSLRRRVALKVLPFAALLDSRAKARFENEARAAATLKHPNIVSIYSVGVERGVHHYAMELVEGQSLAEVIAGMRIADCGLRNEEGSDSEQSAIPNPKSAIETQSIAALATERSTNPKRYFDRVAELGIQAAEALDYAHQHGIVHRDIKPGNLMLDADGKLLVTDFGLARIESDQSLTVTGDLVGTLRYMSPEQALANRGIVDHRSDVYSLGVTLYELATLEPAFTGIDRHELLEQMAFKEPKRPRSITPNMQGDLETILLKAIAKVPSGRFATASELAEDLRRFTEERPITARRQGRVSKMVHWARRNRNIATLSSITLLLLVTMAIGGPIVAVRQRELTDQANEATADAQREAASSNRLRYFSDMRLAYEAWNRQDFRHALSLLESYKQSELRHFEWYFLRNHLHLHEQLESLPHQETISIFALSDDRSKLVASCLDDCFYVWDLDNRERITSQFRPNRSRNSWVASIAVSNDGKTVVIGMESGLVDVVSALSGERIATFKEHDARCLGILLVPGRRAVSGDIEGRLYYWDLGTGKVLRSFDCPEFEITEIRLGPDGRTFATSSGDRLVRLWAIDQVAPLRVIEGPGHSVKTLAFASNGGELLAGTGGGRSLWKWNVETGKGGAVMPRSLVATNVIDLAYSSRLNLLAINGGTQGITILDPESGVPERDVIALPVSGTAKQVAFAYEDRTVVYVDDCEIKLLDLSYLERQRIPEVELTDWWTSLKYIPSREELITCRIPNLHNEGEGSVVAFEGGSRHAKSIHGKERVAAWDVCASLDGDVYAIARGKNDYDDLRGKVTLHDTETGELLRAFDDGENAYISVAFSPDGRLLAAGSGFNDGAVVVWDLRSREVMRRFDVPTPLFIFKAIEFSADSRHLIAGGGLWEHGEIFCWNITTGETVHHLVDVGEVVLEIRPSPDRSEFAVATHDGSIQIYDWPQFTRRLVLDTASDGFAVAYSPDGARLATGGSQKGVRLWDVKTGRQVAFFPTNDRVTELVFINDGRAIAAGISGETHVWSIDGKRTRLSE